MRSSLAGVSSTFLAEGGGGGGSNLFPQAGKSFRTRNFFRRKTFLKMVKPGGQITRCPSPNDTLEACIPINAPTKQLDYELEISVTRAQFF